MNKKHQPTTQELNQSIAALLIVFGRHLSPTYGMNIAKELNQMAEEMIRNGETSVGTLTKDYADSLVADLGSALPKSH